MRLWKFGTRPRGKHKLKEFGERISIGFDGDMNRTAMEACLHNHFSGQNPYSNSLNMYLLNILLLLLLIYP